MRADILAQTQKPVISCISYPYANVTGEAGERDGGE